MNLPSKQLFCVLPGSRRRSWAEFTSLRHTRSVLPLAARKWAMGPETVPTQSLRSARRLRNELSFPGQSQPLVPEGLPTFLSCLENFRLTPHSFSPFSPSHIQRFKEETGVSKYRFFFFFLALIRLTWKPACLYHQACSEEEVGLRSEGGSSLSKRALALGAHRLRLSHHLLAWWPQASEITPLSLSFACL